MAGIHNFPKCEGMWTIWREKKITEKLCLFKKYHAKINFDN